MAGPWDVVTTEQPKRPPQPAQRTTPAATALGGTTQANPAPAPRAPQAAAAAGAAPPGEWDVVATGAAPPEPREVGFAEGAARTAASATIPVVRSLGLADAGLLGAVAEVADLADSIAPLFGLRSNLAERVRQRQEETFRRTDELTGSMREMYQPQPGEEFGLGAQVVGGIAGMPIEMVGGMGAQRGIERSADVLQRGGTGGEAALAGAVSGGANVAANLLPVKVGGAAGRAIETGLGRVLPGGARAGAVAGGAATGGALGAGADIAVAGAENAALPEGEAFTDLQRQAEPGVSGGLGAALGGVAAAVATKGRARGGSPRGTSKAPGSKPDLSAAGTDAATLRRERARNLPVGVELTEGQATGKFEQQQFEKETAKDAGTGKKLRDTFDEQNARIRQNLDALEELTGAEAPEVRGAGKRVVDALVNKASETKRRVDAEYAKAREAGEMAEEVDTTALVTKLRDIEPSAANAGVIKTAEAELVRLGGATRGADGALVPGKLSLDSLEELRKTVGVGGRKDAPNAHFAREIKETIDLTTEDAGGDIYRGARAMYRDYAQEFKNRKIVAQLIENKRGTDERRVALEDVYAKSIKDGSVDEITKLRDTLRGAGLDGQQAWRELQGQVIADIRDSTFRNVSKNERGDRIASVAGMDRVIRDLDKDGKLDLVFGKKGGEVLRDLRDLTADVHSAPAGSVNYSNTASALRNLVDGLATYGLTGLPVPAREVMAQIGRMLRSRSVKKRVDAALPKEGQPARGGGVRPALFEPQDLPPAPKPEAPPRPIPAGRARELPPEPPATGRAPLLRPLPVPEVIEETAARLPVGEARELPAGPSATGRAPDLPLLPVGQVIEGPPDKPSGGGGQGGGGAPLAPRPLLPPKGPKPLPAGEARELSDAEFATWQAEESLGGQAAAEAVRVARARRVDPNAVERAAMQHAKQPGSFARAIDRILEKETPNASIAPETRGRGQELPGQGGRQQGDQQGQDAAGAQAAAAVEETRLTPDVAAAVREFERATEPTGNPITDRLSDRLKSDYSQSVRDYAALPDTNGGTLLNTDLARELSADYLANRTRSADVHEPASAFVKRLYAEKLAGPTPEGRDRRVRFTAGGTGAGKTTGVNALGDKYGSPELTYDTNMNKLASSIEKIEQATKAGREADVVYVYADPVEAFRQAIGRTNRQKAEHGSGRTVPIPEHVKTHVGASKVIRELVDRYRGDLRVNFSFVDNSRGRGNQAEVSLRELPVVGDNGLREQLEAIAREAHRSGEIDDATLAGYLANPVEAGGSGRSGQGVRGSDARSDPPEVAAPALAGYTGSDTSVVTERGMRVPVRYRLVELDDLTTSHRNDLSVNPDFPAEYQPRDRSRAASEAQITRIANELQPELLADSPKASDGAPIISPAGLVESGNARTIALRRAYGAGKADGYRDWIAANAERFGLTGDQVRGMARPALVRERTVDVNVADFARQANEAAVASMSDAEQARADAGQLPDLEGLVTNDDGTLNLARSVDFVRDFMRTVAAPGERGQLMTADGKLSQRGVARIRNAVFSRAYDDTELVARMAEATDGNTRNVMAGLLRAAPEVARLRELSAAGARGDASFVANLIEAVRRFSDAREAGQRVDEYLSQGSLIGGEAPPRVAEFMRQLELDSRAPRRIADWVAGLVQRVESAGDPRQGSLMDDPPRQPLLATDLAEQEVWLQERASAAGHKSIDAWAAADMDGFIRAAKQWRERNPAPAGLAGAAAVGALAAANSEDNERTGEGS